jgi:hypothetical protein
MTGTKKIEASTDRRKYASHRDLLDPEGEPVLQEDHNYITIRGYYNGPDEWVAEHGNALYTPLDLAKALDRGLIEEGLCQWHLDMIKEKLHRNGFDGSSLKLNDLLVALDSNSGFLKDAAGEPLVIICNFELIWKRV